MAESLGSSVLDLTADASALDAGLADAEAATEGSTSRMGQAIGFLEDNWLQVGLAAAAMGGGLEAMARSQAPLTEQTRRLALAMGMTEEEIRAVAGSAANVTLPLSDVLELMEIGRQRGIDNVDALMDFVVAWDTVGDATGESAVELARSSAALGLVGVDAADTTDAYAAFGFMQRETTQDVGEFINMVGMLGPELSDTGLSIDDTAALLGAMERELGLTGRMARREFTQALRTADGNLDTLLDTLGISNETLDEYRGMVEASSEVIEDNAAIHAASFTPMQKFQHWLSELMFSHGALFEAAGMLAMPLIALGPIMRGVGLAATFMTGPFGLIAVAIAAAIAIGVLLIKNWETVLEFLRGLRDAIVGFFTGIGEWLTDVGRALMEGLWDGIRNIWDSVVGWFEALPGRVLGAIGNLARTLYQVGRDLLTGLFNGIRNIWDIYVTWFQRLPGRVIGAIGNVARTLWQVGRALIQGLWDGIRNIWDSVVGWFQRLPGRVIGFFADAGLWLIKAGKAIITGLWEGMKSIWNNVTGWLSNLGSWITGLKGPIETDRILLEPQGEAIMEGLAAGMASGLEGVRRLLADTTMSIEAGINVPVDAGGDADQPAGPLAGATIILQGTPERLIADLDRWAGVQYRLATG